MPLIELIPYVSVLFCALWASVALLAAKKGEALVAVVVAASVLYLTQPAPAVPQVRQVAESVIGGFPW